MLLHNPQATAPMPVHLIPSWKQALKQGGNLLLDELTRDLDVNTLRVLEEKKNHPPGWVVHITN